MPAAPSVGLPEAPSRVWPADQRVGKLDWVDAPTTGDVAKQVVEEVSRASAHGRGLLVYVGAKWCEPCEVFHKAALAGQLDADLAKLRVLAYDLDRDKDRLAAAGYTSDMIPLFAVPKPDGHATGRQFAGSVKGPEAIADLTPKVQRLMQSALRSQARIGRGAFPTRALRNIDFKNLPRFGTDQVPGMPMRRPMGPINPAVGRPGAGGQPPPPAPIAVPTARPAPAAPAAPTAAP